ncbi:MULTISPECIES: hypothetical protein [unclassified Flavobacterium]|uniref:hypothetical protein n=1 Tax=unclassified Flavobacterium TaxID=196869 RepID=UPI001F13D2A7|nr:MULTISPECIES: hypothetical protein [unclassified Flavobacterium]UMY66874.1 hypothetical protein MKO97_05690 [Flavobacterium sp. HJ-32-4]
MDNNAVKKTHFQAGRLHAESYRNFKKILESEEKAEELAEKLVGLIIKKLPQKKDITLLSCRPYANLVLSKTAFKLNRLWRLEDSPSVEVNYAIETSKADEEQARFQFEPSFRSHILIILPVGSTFSVYHQLKSKVGRYIKANSPSSQLLPESFTLFLLESEQDNSLLSAYRKKVTDHVKIQCIEGSAEKSYFLETFVCEVFPENECPLCFPEKASSERYLFPVSQGTGTPMLVVSPVAFDDNNVYENEEGRKFYDVLKIDESGVGAHVFGNMGIGQSRYIHYIKTDLFYQQNKGKVIELFGDEIAKIPKEYKSILIITNGRERSAPVIEDLLADGHFLNRKVTLITYQPLNEPIENLKEYFTKGPDGEKEDSNQHYVIYYTDALSEGVEYREMEFVLQQIRGRTEAGIDRLFTLIDRTNRYTEAKIWQARGRRKSVEVKVEKSKKTQIVPQNDIVAFFKLNVELVASSRLGNPIEERRVTLGKMLEKCHLDALRTYVAGEVEQCKVRSLEETENAAQSDKNEYDFLQGRFSKRHWNLLKLFLFHTIGGRPKQTISIDWILGKENTTRRAQQFFFSNKLIQENDSPHPSHVQLVEDTFVKILSRAPFRNYENIYGQIFGYNLQQLDALMEIIKSSGLTYDRFRRLKFLIRRTVELHSNFVLSKPFLLFLKDDFIDKLGGLLHTSSEFEAKDVRKFSYYLLYCIKEALEGDVAKAIPFEGYLRDIDSEKNGTHELKDLVRDPFLIYCILFKIENILPLRRLSNHIARQADTAASGAIGDIADYIYQKYLADEWFEASFPLSHSRAHELALLFLRQSQFFSDPVKFEEIRRATAKMLATSYFLTQVSERELDQNPAQSRVGDYESNSIRKQVRNVMSSILSVFQTGGDGAALGYALFVEYGGKETTKKEIWPVYPNDGVFDDIRPPEGGLIDLMFDGVWQGADDYSVQTLLPVLRTGDKKDLFITTQPGNTFYRKHAGNNINVEHAFQKDSMEIDLFEDANMLLYFRLSEVKTVENASERATAVLVIYSTELPTVDGFRQFMNVEKVRLLFLLRDDLLAYLNRKIKNDAFVELIHNEALNSTSSALTHGISHYLHVMKSMTEPNPDYLRAADIIIDAIRGQIRAIGAPREDHKPRNVPVYADDLREHFIDFVTFICKEIRLGGKIILHPELKLEVFPRTLYEDLFNVVIPELILNMKKYHPIPEKGKFLFKIISDKDTITFINQTYPGLREKRDLVQKNHGLSMCNKILERLGLPRARIEEGNERFTVTITLKNCG